MTVLDLVDAERRAGFVRFAGTRAAIVLPVRQAVIDEVLPLLPGVPAGLMVALAPDQRVRVQLGAFQATAYVHPVVALAPRPTLRVELASQLVAFGLRMVSLPRFVQVSGREIRVDLASIPALADTADLWPAVESISVSAGEQAWEIAVRVHLVEAAASARQTPPSRPRPTGSSGDAQPSSALVAWARRQWDAGLPAIAGARVTAHVRASVDVLNDWLGDVLRQMASGAVSTRSGAATPDVGRLAGLVRDVRVGAEPGVVTLDVEAGVDG